MNCTIAIRPGTQVVTLNGEIDSDETGEERKTPAGSCGWVSGHNHADHWDVVFPNGAWVVLSEIELRDAAQYQLRLADTLEQHCLALKHGQDIEELTLLDDALFLHTEEVAGNPEHILALIQELKTVREIAQDMQTVIANAWNRWDERDQRDAPKLGDELRHFASVRIGAGERT